ncbi:serine/threonine-protein kinase [Chondromyces apiculatus]|uniref:Serine/threonine protein kinase n=1 Tax=Chondromyces apiculatus DSM 436 TaxID=1192034 RepID=A0A017T594_9BACT|nr:serine/threonine-protein kinase [Chondromyces apiculatus]EYF03975.1 serine/threonine protein kinase [Chondromyces apiculatus DSM 436]
MDREAIQERRARERVGTVLRDKWTLERLIGIGGMASVYAARHRNGKLGAVKLLHLELAHDQEWRERFLREGYTANTISHPGVVAVLDDDVTDEGSVFLVMDLLEGETADARMGREPTKVLDPGEVVRVALGVLDVLVAAHVKGIVHRDIKPENVFLTRDGQVKVLDFGIARLREMPAGTSSVTRTGATMGTPAYMPPEQALGHNHEIDARTDLWAVGATMFSLLTGRFVHEADTANKLLLAAMTRAAPPVLTHRPDVSAGLAAIVDQALAFERKDRFQSAEEMREALRTLLASGEGALFGPSDGGAAGKQAVRITVPVTSRLPASALGRTATFNATTAVQEPVDVRQLRPGPSVRAGVALVGTVVAGIALVAMLRGRSAPDGEPASADTVTTQPAAASLGGPAPAPSASSSVSSWVAPPTPVPGEPTPVMGEPSPSAATHAPVASSSPPVGSVGGSPAGSVRSTPSTARTSTGKPPVTSAAKKQQDLMNKW